MRNALTTAALLAAFVSGVSGAALAQTSAAVCPTGYYLSNGICQPSASAHPAAAVGYGSSAPAKINPGPGGFGPTSFSYTGYKQDWKAAPGACPTGDVMASWGTGKNGCYPAH